MRRRLVVLVCLLPSLGLMYAAWSFTRPMTVSLTFDDGFRTHATIAAGRLEERGWHGAFAVVPGLLSSARRMTAEQVVQLSRRGHALYPHGLSHRNLHKLWAAGETDEVHRQIAGSILELERLCGKRPAYFVYPENDSLPETDGIVRSFGVRPYDRGRADFGDDSRHVDTRERIGEFLLRQIRQGQVHTDVMVHGIVSSDGGWHPFPSEAEFVRFLDVIQELEKAGRLKVVDYEAAPREWIRCLHWLYAVHVRGRMLCDWLFGWRARIYG